MKFIHYDGSAIMTGDAIADAVADYAAVLGANGRTDTVDIPTPDEHGMNSTATLLLGPASQIVLQTAPDDELEPEDTALIDELRRRAATAGPERPVHSRT